MVSFFLHLQEGIIRHIQVLTNFVCNYWKIYTFCFASLEGDMTIFEKNFLRYKYSGFSSKNINQNFVNLYIQLPFVEQNMVNTFQQVVLLSPFFNEFFNSLMSKCTKCRERKWSLFCLPLFFTLNYFLYQLVDFLISYENFKTVFFFFFKK